MDGENSTVLEIDINLEVSFYVKSTMKKCDTRTGFYSFGILERALCSPLILFEYLVWSTSGPRDYDDEEVY